MAIMIVGLSLIASEASSSESGVSSLGLQRSAVRIVWDLGETSADLVWIFFNLLFLFHFLPSQEPVQGQLGAKKLPTWRVIHSLLRGS